MFIFNFIDLHIRIVKNLVVYYDTLMIPYVVGVESSMFSLRNITEAIKNEVNKKNFVYCEYSSLFLNSRVTVRFFF